MARPTVYAIGTESCVQGAIGTRSRDRYRWSVPVVGTKSRDSVTVATVTVATVVAE